MYTQLLLSVWPLQMAHFLPPFMYDSSIPSYSLEMPLKKWYNSVVLWDWWGEAMTFQISYSISAESPPWRTQEWFPAWSIIWKGTSHAGTVLIDDNCHGARWQPMAHYFSWKLASCWDIFCGTAKIASISKEWNVKNLLLKSAGSPWPSEHMAFSMAYMQKNLRRSTVNVFPYFPVLNTSRSKSKSLPCV